MPRRHGPPSYRHHKQSGQAVVTLTDGCGGRRDVLLGKHGTAASRREYARVIAEWEASGRQLPSAAGHDPTINELALAFWEHAQRHYRDQDGNPTREQDEYKRALRVLKHLYGPQPARSIGPLALKAVRELMVLGYDHPKYGPQAALARGVVNQRIGRLRRVFKWAVANELVPPSVYHGLQALGGLQRGRTEARETKPITPVAEAMVNATLPYLNRFVAAMVQVQLLTGARPGEVCVMRACDLDVSGPVWLFNVPAHKTAHHGHERIIAIGPQAQEALRPFLRADMQGYLFSPALAMEERHQARKEARQTPMTPSQARRRRKRRPKRAPGDRYTTQSYSRAVRDACPEAFPLPAELAPRISPEGKRESARAWRERLTAEEKEAVRQWRREHTWHVHQLRHTAATKLRREFGLDVARCALGHRTPAVTAMYAEADAAKAMDAMAKIG
jgi:integrase